ncbi:MAG: porin [Deltaproteobacteria bacterium]|nr:porin [Deltaproteobacteria bacterium]
MKKLFILFVAVAMVAAFTVPAAADAEWNFYGSARMTTFYVDDDPDTVGVDSDAGTVWAQQGNSRIGAKVKFNDEIGGRFEMSDSFGKRLLYGTYNFGGGELLLGQSYTPVTYFYSNSVMNGDGDLLNIGQFYEGRQPMIQLKFPFGLKFAAVTPTGTTVAGYDTDVVLPKLELSYGFKTDLFFIDVFGGYQTIDLESPAGDESIDAIVYGIGGGANIGPVYFKLGAHQGQNLGNFASVWDQVGGRNMGAGSDGLTVTDNDAMGYLAVVGFKAGDAATIELGYGYEEFDSNLAGEQADETSQYYVNATINITKGFFLVPEIGLVDRSESEVAGVEEGDITYFGLKWQINF